jgi:hypothetical protein
VTVVDLSSVLLDESPGGGGDLDKNRRYQHDTDEHVGSDEAPDPQYRQTLEDQEHEEYDKRRAC